MAEDEWWYAKGGTRHGPCSDADLEQRLVSGEISPHSRVWRKGMEGWTRMAEVQALQDMLRGCPPPLDEEDHADVGLPPPDLVPAAPPPAQDRAGHWSRFVARQIDFLVFGVVAGTALFLIFPDLRFSTVLDNSVVATLLTILLALLLEVPVMALTGGTVGKWIFGITVRRNDGSKLRMGELFRRNLLLWVHGLGLGIPLVNLFFLGKSYRVAREGRRNRWDENALHLVCQKPIGRLRWTAGFAFWVISVAAINRLDLVLAMATEPKAVPAATWVNPLTNDRAILYKGWRSVPEQVKDNPGLFWFENRNSVVIMGRQVVEGIDLAAYIEGLQANADFGQLEDKRVEIDAQGTTYYILSHRETSNGQSLRVDVKVWQTAPAHYWRSVVTSPLNNQTERAEARALAGVLEKTSLTEKSGGGFTSSRKRY